MALVLIAEQPDKAKALDQIDIDLCFDDSDNVIINEHSKKLAELLPFIYTLENWRDSGLNAFEMIEPPTPKIHKGSENRGIQITDKVCLDYQRFKPNEIIEMYKDTKFNKSLIKWYEYLTTWYDMQENECSSFLLMSVINSMEDHIYRICKFYAVEDFDVHGRIKIFKHIHTLVRLTACNIFGGYYNDMEYLQMQYLQDLCNRRVYMAVDNVDNLMSDLGLRVHPPPGFRWLFIDIDNNVSGDTELFKTKLYEVMLEMYGKVADNIHTTELIDFDTAWFTRSNTMPSGAATGFKYKGLPLDKRAAHELGMVNKDEVLDDNPLVYASTSMKYENGKCRFLYSNDVYDQYRTDYILSLTEKYQNVLYESGIGLTQSQELQKEIDRIIAITSGNGCYSFDYTDYNNQHTLNYMKIHWIALKDALLKRFGKQAATYAKMIDIKVKSMENRFAGKLGPNGVVAKCLDTLFSGSRETQTLNTNNNIAYSRVIKDNLKQFFNFDVSKWIHAVGDDQIGEAKSQRWAIITILFMIVMGCEGNPNKIILGLEFLRKIYFKSGNVSGYLNRSIANLVSRDQNRTERVDRHSIPESLITQLRKIVSRLGNVHALTILYDWVIYNRCVFINGDNLVRIPMKYIYAKKQNGGLGIKPLLGDLNNLKINKPKQQPKLQINGIPAITQGMSYDLIQYLEKRFNINLENKNELLSNMRQKNLINLASAEDKKAWYAAINNYYNNIDIYEDNTNILEIPCGKIIKGLLTKLTNLFLGEEKIKDYYNPIEQIQSLIAKTEIKNYDVFNNLLRQVCKQYNMAEISAMNYIFKKYLNDEHLVTILQTAVQKCGIQMVIDILSDNIKYNSILEGYVRDTVLVFIRHYVLNYFITDNDLYKHVNQENDKMILLMESVEIALFKDMYDQGIWIYIKP